MLHGHHRRGYLFLCGDAGEEIHRPAAEGNDDTSRYENIAHTGKRGNDAAEKKLRKSQQGRSITGTLAFEVESEGRGGGHHHAEEEHHHKQQPFHYGKREVGHKGGSHAQSQDKKYRGSHPQGCGSTGKPRGEQARPDHDGKGIQAETDAVKHGTDFVVLLEYEWRSGDVTEQNPHGEGLYEQIEGKLPVAQHGNKLRECRQNASLETILGQEGLFLSETDEGENDADGQQYDEDAPPVGPFEHDATQYRRTYRCNAVDGGHEGEGAGQCVAGIEVGDDGA